MLAEPHRVTHCFSAASVREMDRRTIEECGVPGIQLMKQAGRFAFENLLKQWPAVRRIVVCCGGGNNGGDGYIVAALARQRGLDVQVLTMSDPASLHGDCLLAAGLAMAEGVAVESLPISEIVGKLQPFLDRESRDEEVDGNTVLVDALLGTGLKGHLRDDMLQFIRAINDSDLPVLALDLPSGLCSDTGSSLGAIVRANMTATFVGLKRGLLTHLGPEHAGQIVYDRLQVPETLLLQDEGAVALLQEQGLPKLLPRSRHAHKGDFGHVMVVGGDVGFGGAAAMAAEAALRTGAGLVSVATQPMHVAALLSRRPELMVHGVVSGQELEPLLERASVIVVGPGLGRTPWSEQLLQKAAECDCPMVMDADALNLLAGGRVITDIHHANRVMTPHPGEAARLLGCSTDEVQADRFAAAEALQKQYGGVVVLKGAGTLVRTGAQTFLATGGNPGMASGGMGDVLSGIIVGLLAQGLSLEAAATTGVILHNAAADRASVEFGERSMLATDLFRYLPALLKPQVVVSW